MPRLTRRESQAKTRDALLATAKTCFLRDGYAATSLDGIAEAAGFSKGAVYSNFESKDELCLAVLDTIRLERAAALAAAMEGRESLEERLDALERWADTHLGDRAWTALEVAFAVHAARIEALSTKLSARQAAVHAAVVAIVEAEAARHALSLPMAPEAVATTILSLGIGLGVQRAIDPSLSPRALVSLVRHFVGAGEPSTPGAARASARNRAPSKGSPARPRRR